MNKLIIQHNGEDIEFLMHDLTQSQFLIKVEFVTKILKGITYPVVNDLKPKIIFDIGAHIGATSAFFSMQYPKSQIFSFEPTTINFSLLEKNTQTIITNTDLVDIVGRVAKVSKANPMTGMLRGIKLSILAGNERVTKSSKANRK